MPQSMTLTAPNGRQLTIQGDHVPSEAELHDIFTAAGVEVSAPQGQAPPADQSSALARGASEFYHKSPLAAVVNTAESMGNVIAHPLDTLFGLKPIAGTVRDLARAQWDEAVKAADAAKRAAGGDGLSAVEAVGHGMAAILPILGPAAANVGEHGASGDLAGMVGGAAGLLLPFAAKYGLETKQAGSMAPTRGRLAAANTDRADLLEREATHQISQQVLAPGNPKYKGTASAIAPEVLDRKLTGDRLQLQQLADEGMHKAGSQIDAAVQSHAGPMPLTPIIQALNQRLNEFHVNGEVIPTSAGKVKALAGLRDYLHKLSGQTGGSIPFEQLRAIRDEFYDAADKAKGYQMTGGNEHLADMGWAAREAGGAIRETIGQLMPDLRAANAEYTFWKRLNDVLDPDLGRPKKTNYVPSGVTGGQSTAGAVMGAAAGMAAKIPGIAGVTALIGGELLPRIKAVTASPAWQLASAQKKVALANALRNGDVRGVQAMLTSISQAAPRDASTLAGVPALAQSTPDNRQTR